MSNHVLVIDNYDSFTYNLVHYLEKLEAKVSVVFNNVESIDRKILDNITHVLLSPGPGKVKDTGITLKFLGEFYNKLPILGVCMGHQCIGSFFNAKIIHAKSIMHGKRSKIKVKTNNNLFNNIPDSFQVMRYHSYVIDKKSILVDSDLEILAMTNDDENEVMSIAHKKLPIYGVQYHPESILSEYGEQLLENFLCYNR